MHRFENRRVTCAIVVLSALSMAQASRAQTAPGQMGPGAGAPALGAVPAPPALPAPARPAAPSPLSPAPMSSTPMSSTPAIPMPGGASSTQAPSGQATSVQAPAAQSPAGLQPGAVPAANAAATPPKPKPKPPIREWALSTDPTPSFQPETFFATAKASERYAQIADAGGWPTISGNVGPGSRGPVVAALRKRLAIEGDPQEAVPAGEAWDAQLAAAVKHFQARNGLRETGVVAGATLRAINVPARTRFKQLASSSQRLAGVNFPFGDRYVAVNIPSAAVETIENGRVFKRYVAVVGDVDHQSPEVTARISAVNLNPTWTVPTSIIKNEIIPKMRKDAGYLSRQKIRILDNRGTEVDPRAIDWGTEKAVNYTLRQDSGKGNALGSIRIQMNNKHSVYMHDTPSKAYFGRDYRFLSHGCVRVAGVYDLAAWLLEGSGSYTTADLTAKIGKEREDLKLVKPVPVIWVYMTGWASADGTVHFADDVYQVDTIGLQASR